MSLINLNTNIINYLTKFLDPCDTQNLSTTCKDLRNKIFTDLFFERMPELLGLYTVSIHKTGENKRLVKKSRAEIQKDLRDAVNGIFDIWKKIHPTTKITEQKQNGHLAQLRSLRKEVAAVWTNDNCAILGAPASLTMHVSKFSKDFCALLDCTSRTALASYQNEEIEEASATLPSLSNDTVIKGPLKLSIFHIWLFTIITHQGDQSLTQRVLNTMPVSIKPISMQYAVVNSLVVFDEIFNLRGSAESKFADLKKIQFVFNLALQESVFKWPKHLKESVTFLRNVMMKGNILHPGDAQDTISAIVSQTHFIARISIPPLLNPLPFTMEELIETGILAPEDQLTEEVNNFPALEQRLELLTANDEIDQD